MSINDRSAYRESDSHPLRLGRVERIEQSCRVLRIEANAGVLHVEAHVIVLVQFAANDQKAQPIPEAV